MLAAHEKSRYDGVTGDESFQATTCTSTDNSNQPRESTPAHKKQNKQTGPK